MSGRVVYVNGVYKSENDAVISIFDRGFIFGDGIYEVTTVIGGKLIDCEAHLARLERSCQEIQLDIPWTREELIALHHEIIVRNAVDEGTMYLQITRGKADRDFVFPTATKPTLVIFSQARLIAETAISKTGMRVISMRDIRWRRRDIKSTNLLAPVLARQFAKGKNAHEAWLIEDGFVTEGAASTAWIVKGSTLISRPLSHQVLPGITRKAVLTFLEKTGFSFEERLFSIEEALSSDEAFATSAGYLVLPVVSIDDKLIGKGTPGPVAQALRGIYLDLAAHGGALG